MAKRDSRNALNPLPSLIRASSWDAGNFSMRDGGRKVWSRKDYNAAAATQNRLIDACYGPTIRDRYRFQVAERLERSGYLSLSMPLSEMMSLIDAYVEAEERAINNQVCLVHAWAPDAFADVFAQAA